LQAILESLYIQYKRPKHSIVLAIHESRSLRQARPKIGQYVDLSTH